MVNSYPEHIRVSSYYLPSKIPPIILEELCDIQALEELRYLPLNIVPTDGK